MEHLIDPETFKAQWEAEVRETFGPNANPANVAAIKLIMFGETPEKLTDEQLAFMIGWLKDSNLPDARMAACAKNALYISNLEQEGRNATTKREKHWFTMMKECAQLGAKKILKERGKHHRWLLKQRRELFGKDVIVDEAENAE